MGNRDAAAKLLDTRNALFLAFNKSIADYLATKLQSTPMSARTIHSIGMGMLGRYWGRDAVIPPPDPTKYLKLCRAWAHDNFANLDGPRQQQVSTALRELVDYTRATLTTPSDVEAMSTMASHFGVECDVVLLDALIQAVPQILEEGARIAMGGEEEQEEQATHVIDFTDMLYLPHIWNLPANQRADWLFIDEAQDLSAAQLEIVLKCRGPNGRMLFVGDRHQAIYGFSGADSEAFDHIKQVTHSTELPLSVCYRCPTSHIALAQHLVPEIEPRQGAPEGVIVEVTPAQLPQMVRKREGDLMLGRKTAPLIELCIRLIRDGVFARVKGREIGVRLTQVVQEVTHVHGYSWQRFGQCLQAYERQQAEKLSQFEDAEAELVRLNDRVAAVRVCYEMFEARDAAELCRKIDELFDSEHPDVTLSTVQKAKGLEADRIFLLNPEEMPLKWPNQQEWELQQERNIKYVALTRARQELYLVHSMTNS